VSRLALAKTVAIAIPLISNIKKMKMASIKFWGCARANSKCVNVDSLNLSDLALTPKESRRPFLTGGSAVPGVDLLEGSKKERKERSELHPHHWNEREEERRLFFFFLVHFSYLSYCAERIDIVFTVILIDSV
jgi:hypothetical protein